MSQAALATDYTFSDKLNAILSCNDDPPSIPELLLAARDLLAIAEGCHQAIAKQAKKELVDIEPLTVNIFKHRAKVLRKLRKHLEQMP
jgi:hypothetical protein